MQSNDTTRYGALLLSNIHVCAMNSESLLVLSGKRMNVGLNSAVGAGFFPARKTGVCCGYGAGVALGSQKQSIHA